MKLRSAAVTIPLGLVLATALGGAAACSDDNPASPGQPTGDGGPTGTPEGSVPPGAQTTLLSRPSRGSALDISEDDTLLVAVNRDLGTVSVFTIDATATPPTMTKKTEVSVCEQPYQIALAPNGDKAWVVCRKDQKVVRLDALRSAPAKGPEVAVGSEPTGIALTPKATAAWVANWIDGTVSEIDTDKMTLTSTTDLNAVLAATGVLGQGLTSRPALAHPRSVAITNNKDNIENDESVFVTEFFAQQKDVLAADGSNADAARQGVVYRIRLSDKSVTTINLPPISDIGVTDHAGGTAGCFPNQLQSINIEGSFAYINSICASPKGPAGDFGGPAKAACAADATCPGAAAGSCDLVAGTCKTNCTADADCGKNGGVCTANVCNTNLWDAKVLQTAAVSVIDIGGNKVVASVALNDEFGQLYTSKSTPDTTARRMPLDVPELAFVPGTLIAYMPAKGADAVFRVDFNATYETKAVDSVGNADKPFITLDVGTIDATKQGKTPIAIAMAHAAKTDAPTRLAYVLNESTRNVTVLDLKVEDIAGLPDNPDAVASAAMPTTPADTAALEGKRLFDTGLGRWSLNGQAWGACESCHWEGLSDQVTWFHLRGDRQTPSIDQTASKKTPGQLRVNNWQANADELPDHEGGALRVTLGGVGAEVSSLDLKMSSRIPFDKNGHGGLAGSMSAAVDPTSPSSLVTTVNLLDDWENVVAYEKTIRTPRKPSNLTQADVDAGKTIFTSANCQGCHGGDQWTISRVFYTPDANVASPSNLNKALISTSWTTAVTTANFPAALLPTAIAANQTMRYSGANAAALDQLTCALRNVGTFNVAESGVGIAELKRNMTAVAQGNEPTGQGFNPPSLLGLAINAPYFHAGNARTLEALLSAPFAAHYAALSSGFLSGADAATKRAQLVAFLLSIDGDTDPLTIPALGPTGGSFCATP